ncbi:MAG: SPOR domain-containing protein [Armatimonadetes bacterium]|nr:SPOR domain-containing protein [Armatimonadota bacterium]
MVAPPPTRPMAAAAAPSPARSAERRPTGNRGRPEPNAAVEERFTSTVVAPPAEERSPLFRVQVGAPGSRQEALRLRDEISRKTKMKAQLLATEDGFRVQVGAFKNRANAEKLAEDLRVGGERDTGLVGRP